MDGLILGATIGLTAGIQSRTAAVPDDHLRPALRGPARQRLSGTGYRIALKAAGVQLVASGLALVVEFSRALV